MSLLQLPPPIETLDAEKFRREIAGLVDPEARTYRPEEFRDQASYFCVMLAHCYNRDELDAIKLWDRIATAVSQACQKVDNGDLDMLIHLALEHVKADPAVVARNEFAINFIGDMARRDDSWKLAFVRYLKLHLYPAVIHGRALWETIKEDRKAGVN